MTKRSIQKSWDSKPLIRSALLKRIHVSTALVPCYWADLGKRVQSKIVRFKKLHSGDKLYSTYYRHGIEWWLSDRIYAKNQVLALKAARAHLGKYNVVKNDVRVEIVK